MDPIHFMITAAGFTALIERADGIRITALGVSQSAFIMAPTITVVPGEFKRIDAVSGEAASDTVIHMTAQDVSTDIYELRGMGLYLDDGTLFAVYSQAEPLFRKVSIAFFLLAMDIAFENGNAGDISFGDTSFLMPPATETVKGVAEIATPAEAAARVDHSRIISPLTLGLQLLAERGETDTDLSALANAFDALLAALTARTITGTGLATGGGSLSASRTINVRAASVAETIAGLAADCAITPWSLAGFPKYLGQDGYFVLPGGAGLMLQFGRFVASANASTAATFPLAFPTACLAVVPVGGVSGGADSQDNPPVLVESTITRFGFSVFSADDSAAGMRFIAIGN